MPKNSKRILILSSAEVDESIDLNDSFVQRLSGPLDGVAQIEWQNYHQVGLEFKTNHIRAYLLKTNTDLSDFDFVYFKSYARNSEQANAIAEYLQAMKVRFTCSELTEYMPLTKLTQLARLARAGLPIPTSVFLPSDAWLARYDHIATQLGSPFIFKAIDASGGESNFLISSKPELEKALLENQDLLFIAQKFIKNSGDLRILIIDKQIKLVMRRQRTDNTTHLNNTSQGGSAELLSPNQLADESHTIALKAAEIMRREIAGVDLMFEQGSDNPYILEVNASPQIASGAFIEEKLNLYSNFFINMLK